MSRAPRILWTDCLGGLFVGILVLTAHQFIADWHNLSKQLILFMGAVNLAYGCYSLFVTLRTPRPLILVKLLAMANIIWLPVCTAITAYHWNDISAIGIIHVLGEGVYVAGLGLMEWTRREQLAS